MLASLARSFTPPESVYLMALPTRFSSTWRSLPASTATNRGRSGVTLQSETESLFHGPDPHQRLHFVQQLVQVNFGLLQDHSTGLNLGHVQDIVN